MLKYLSFLHLLKSFIFYHFFHSFIYTTTVSFFFSLFFLAFSLSLSFHETHILSFFLHEKKSHAICTRLVILNIPFQQIFNCFWHLFRVFNFFKQYIPLFFHIGEVHFFKKFLFRNFVIKEKIESIEK